MWGSTTTAYLWGSSPPGIMSSSQLPPTHSTSPPPQSSNMDLDATATVDPTNELCLRWNKHHSNMSEYLSELSDILFSDKSLQHTPGELNRLYFTDVTFACEDGVHLYAHRSVLASASTYFKKLFKSEYLSSAPMDLNPYIILKDTNSSDLKKILEFIYCGNIAVKRNKMDRIVGIARNLKVKGLICEEEEAMDLTNADCSSKKTTGNLSSNLREDSSISIIKEENDCKKPINSNANFTERIHENLIHSRSSTPVSRFTDTLSMKQESLPVGSLNDPPNLDANTPRSVSPVIDVSRCSSPTNFRASVIPTPVLSPSHSFYSEAFRLSQQQAATSNTQAPNPYHPLLLPAGLNLPDVRSRTRLIDDSPTKEEIPDLPPVSPSPKRKCLSRPDFYQPFLPTNGAGLQGVDPKFSLGNLPFSFPHLLGKDNSHLNMLRKKTLSELVSPQVKFPNIRVSDSIYPHSPDYDFSPKTSNALLNLTMDKTHNTVSNPSHSGIQYPNMEAGCSYPKVERAPFQKLEGIHSPNTTSPSSFIHTSTTNAFPSNPFSASYTRDNSLIPLPTTSSSTVIAPNSSRSPDGPTNIQAQYASPSASGYTNCLSYGRPEGNRYKQYSKEDMNNAIEEVKKGETCLKVSKKYKIPSRTLYDKIKKSGIATSNRRAKTTRLRSNAIPGAPLNSNLSDRYENRDSPSDNGRTFGDMDMHNGYRSEWLENSSRPQSAESSTTNDSVQPLDLQLPKSNASSIDLSRIQSTLAEQYLRSRQITGTVSDDVRNMSNLQHHLSSNSVQDMSGNNNNHYMSVSAALSTYLRNHLKPQLGILTPSAINAQDPMQHSSPSPVGRHNGSALDNSDIAYASHSTNNDHSPPIANSPESIIAIDSGNDSSNNDNAPIVSTEQQSTHCHETPQNLRLSAKVTTASQPSPESSGISVIKNLSTDVSHESKLSTTTSSSSLSSDESTSIRTPNETSPSLSVKSTSGCIESDEDGLKNVSSASGSAVTPSTNKSTSNGGEAASYSVISSGDLGLCSQVRPLDLRETTISIPQESI